jgi:Phytanoyl-CoA dioxygenase (PhyH)
MRNLYVISGGYLFESLNRYVANKAVPKPKFQSGIKALPTQDITVLKHLIHMNCFAPDKSERIGAIDNFLDVDVGTVRINPLELFACKPIAELVTHELWLSEAQKIIGSNPIAVGVDAWWSKPTSKSKIILSDAAQLWHRDLDRLRDVKIFFYATDVNDENGPFEFVEGSHLPSLSAFSMNQGRYDEKWVQSRYPRRPISMTGKAGTTFIVDTNGIHRGRPVEHGLRCILELYFSSSLFGAEFQYQPRLGLDPSWPSYPVWNGALNRYPTTWGSLFK